MNAALVARVAGILSPYVGSVAAIECAAQAVHQSAPDCVVTLPEAVQACIRYRRMMREASAMYPAWPQVTADQAAEMVASVSRMATEGEG